MAITHSQTKEPVYFNEERKEDCSNQKEQGEAQSWDKDQTWSSTLETLHSFRFLDQEICSVLPVKM